MKKFTIFVMFVLACYGLFRGIAYLSNRPLVSEENGQAIDVSQDPDQRIFKEPKLLYARADGFRVLAIAEYKIKGVILGKSVNQKFGGESIYPVDLGIVWGEPAESDFDDYLNTYYTTAITDTNRTIWIDFKKDPPLGWSREYIMHHLSNNHISPANENIYNAVIVLRKKYQVTLEGYLLRTDWNGGHAKDSSLSRTDSDCEDFYVNKIQVGEKIYQ
jgi:hypothetical protein